MERGYNRALAVNVFETGQITTAIVEGQKRSDEAQRTKQIRLGYMGHLTLVAEEVVKFSERHPPELLSPSVMEAVLNPEWIEYVEQTLTETRERDNAILGGVRPDMSVGSRQTMLGSGQGFSSSSNALAEAGLNGGIGGSSFQGFDLNHGSVSGGAFGGGSTSLLSGFASSSDDDEDEDMEEHDDRNVGNADQDDSENVSTSATSQPIPILPPPPAPLSLGPSRARRQLAARLAAQKQQAAENAENDEEEGRAEGDQWPTNPFVIAGVDDDGEGNSAFPNSDFPSNPNQNFSPTFPESEFSPSDSLSNSSDEDGDHAGTTRRRPRMPLEVEEDDDEMGEMVGPSATGAFDSDEEDEAIINESLGYSNLPAPSRYSGFRRSRAVSGNFEDEQNDSSDGEDDGLVEILVPGRKSSTSH
ncbi:SIT4 phosphatase-associated protein family [Penicillium capsulatum]|nr:SIT4 phosphatase-associated protein family [Penicillium capsulatum]